MTMKTLKLVLCLLILAIFVAGMLTGCASQSYQCSTYSGHYSNLYAKYPRR